MSGLLALRDTGWWLWLVVTVITTREETIVVYLHRVFDHKLALFPAAVIV